MVTILTTPSAVSLLRVLLFILGDAGEVNSLDTLKVLIDQSSFGDWWLDPASHRTLQQASREIRELCFRIAGPFRVPSVVV